MWLRRKNSRARSQFPPRSDNLGTGSDAHRVGRPAPANDPTRPSVGPSAPRLRAQQRDIVALGPAKEDLRAAASAHIEDAERAAELGDTVPELRAYEDVVRLHLEGDEKCVSVELALALERIGRLQGVRDRSGTLSASAQRWDDAATVWRRLGQIADAKGKAEAVKAFRKREERARELAKKLKTSSDAAYSKSLEMVAQDKALRRAYSRGIRG